jgi:hypothetical protein
MTDVGTSNLRFPPLTSGGAWQAYLEATRAADGEGYAQIEQAAWEQLQATLARLPSEPVGAA